jgi:Na+/H+-dicarboxylate symporter
MTRIALLRKGHRVSLQQPSQLLNALRPLRPLFAFLLFILSKEFLGFSQSTRPISLFRSTGKSPGGITHDPLTFLLTSRSRIMEPSSRKSVFTRISPPARILLGMVAGAAVGLAFGPQVAGLGEIGKVVIGLIKMLATPLILFVILDALLRSSLKGKSGLRMIVISMINGLFAIAIALTLANTLKPGRFLEPPTSTTPSIISGARPLRILEDILGMIPTNLIDPFRNNAIIPVVMLAVCVGIALRKFKSEQIESGASDYLAIEGFVSGGLRSCELLLGWVVALLPFAVFAVMAHAIGTQGLSVLGGLAKYAGVVMLGLLLQIGLVYQGWLVFFARMPLRTFWSVVKTPVIFAAGSSSSLATLPITLRSLKQLGVSDSSARMSACVATNLNNDGILLYEALAAMIVAQAFGITLGFGEQLMVAATCVLATIGVAGVPEAGMISLAVVLTSAKLPLELLPLMLTVDWILGRARAITNVVGDCIGAVVLDRFEANHDALIEKQPAYIDPPSQWGTPIESPSRS